MLEGTQRNWPRVSTLTAVKSALRECIAAVGAWHLAMIRNREHRRAIGHLLTLDDRLLKDIGFTRSDLIPHFRHDPTDR